MNLISINGGESGIRTRDTVSRIHTFQACAFNHSATSPFAASAQGTNPFRRIRNCAARCAPVIPGSPIYRQHGRKIRWLMRMGKPMVGDTPRARPDQPVIDRLLLNYRVWPIIAFKKAHYSFQEKVYPLFHPETHPIRNPSP